MWEVGHEPLPSFVLLSSHEILRGSVVSEEGYADSQTRVLLGMVDMKSSHRTTSKDFLRSSPSKLELRRQSSHTTKKAF